MTSSTETPREKAIRCFSNVVTEHIDGILYQQWSSPFLPHVAQAKVLDFEFRPDDVILEGWPRSGNHWTYFVVDMILKQSTTPARDSYAERIPVLWPDEKRESVVKEASPRIFATHRWLQKFPDVPKKKPKVIYVIRNPKDAFLSYYTLEGKFAKEHKFDGSWDEFFDVSLAGEITWGGWFEHVIKFEEYIRENPDIDVYIHQFEEMKTNPVECVKKLCKFLGKPDTMAEEIVAASDVDKVKQAVQSQQSNNKFFPAEESQSHFIRKGNVGNWKRTFTVEQNERFNRAFEETVGGSELAGRVRKYL